MAIRKLPYPPMKPNAVITVKAAGSLSVNGSQVFKETFEGEGFYVERSAWVQNNEGKKVESKGLVIFLHDICTSVPELTGEVIVNDLTKSIIVGKRLKNPDGSVHHVELELM